MDTKHPGSERGRDEAREGGPRYHGASWHDAEESRAEGPEMQELDALPEAVHGAEHEGMGRGHSRHRKDETRDPPPGVFAREIHADHEPAAPSPPDAPSAEANGLEAATERARHVPERR